MIGAKVRTCARDSRGKAGANLVCQMAQAEGRSCLTDHRLAVSTGGSLGERPLRFNEVNWSEPLGSVRWQSHAHMEV